MGKSRNLLMRIALAAVMLVTMTACAGEPAKLELKENAGKVKVAEVDRFAGKGVIPDFVGMSAVEAITLAGRADYYPDFFELIEGEPKDIYYTTDETEKLQGYFVCSQTYPVGAKPDSGSWMTHLKLIVDKSCNAVTNYYRVGAFKLTSTSWEPSPYDYESSKVEGWIFSYGWDTYSAPNQVEVMTASGVVEFEIAQVDVTADVMCDFDEEEQLNHVEDALALKRELLPIGTPALLVRDGSSSGSSSFFFHVLSPQGVPVNGEPPVGSVNESLVLSGLWSLDNWAYEEKPDYVKPTMQKFKINKSSLGDGELDAAYAQLMVAAANKARKADVPVMKACLKAKDKAFIGFWGKSDARGDTSGGGSYGGGGGSGCTYVSGYFRRGHYVRGHIRC